jgi:hypothetical protein
MFGVQNAARSVYADSSTKMIVALGTKIRLLSVNLLRNVHFNLKLNVLEILKRLHYLLLVMKIGFVLHLTLRNSRI